MARKQTADEQWLADCRSRGLEISEGKTATLPEIGPQRSNAEVFRDREAATIREDSVVVTMPPGVNSLYPTINGVRRKSKKYKEWSSAAAFDVSRLGHRSEYPVRVKLTVEGKMRVGTDIDGKIKAILDCMVNVGVLEGDDWRYVSAVSIEYKPTEGGNGIRVQLEKA